MDTVLATQVRSVDPPQFIAEAENEITEGQRFALEQCDTCGNTSYDAVMHGGRWFVKCVPDDGGIYAGIEGVGCGREYAVKVAEAEGVTF